MAFKKINTSDLSKILDYTQFLKKPDDPCLKMFQGQDGVFLNITRIEQTPEDKKISDEMSEIYKNYNKQLVESKEDVKRDS